MAQMVRVIRICEGGGPARTGVASPKAGMPGVGLRREKFFNEGENLCLARKHGDSMTSPCG